MHTAHGSWQDQGPDAQRGASDIVGAAVADHQDLSGPEPQCIDRGSEDPKVGLHAADLIGQHDGVHEPGDSLAVQDGSDGHPGIGDERDPKPGIAEGPQHGDGIVVGAPDLQHHFVEGIGQGSVDAGSGLEQFVVDPTVVGEGQVAGALRIGDPGSLPDAVQEGLKGCAGVGLQWVGAACQGGVQPLRGVPLIDQGRVDVEDHTLDRLQHREAVSSGIGMRSLGMIDLLLHHGARAYAGADTLSPMPAEDSSPAPDALGQAEDDLPEQMRVRHAKRDRLIEQGREAYPVQLPVTASIGEVRAEFKGLEPDARTGVQVGLTGRVIFVRNTGKLCFATLRAGDGSELQAMLSLNEIGQESLDQWKALVDLGDLVFVQGEVIASRRGELSVLAARWEMAAKALRPLPVAHRPMNEDTRIRQRYVDLIVRPQARQMAITRVTAVKQLRRSLDERGYLEIETPMLQTMHGGATARPFVTVSNAFDIELFLRIAPELFLKRAVVGGLERVYEINRNFRNEGSDSTHSPEFAMLEFYQAYADYRQMATITRELIQEAAQAVFGSLVVTHMDGSEHDLSGTWPEVSLYGSLSEAIGTEITPQTPRSVLVDVCDRAGIAVAPTWIPGKLVEELFEHYVIDSFDGRPTFVMDYPVDTSPLVRDHRDEQGKVEKWDLYVNGYEQATGYSELVDPVIQRQRLMAQAELGARGDAEAMRLDEDFLRALEHGMPPSGGVGLGIDRLLMTLTGLGIRETVLFPLVKPQAAGVISG